MKVTLDFAGREYSYFYVNLNLEIRAIRRPSSCGRSSEIWRAIQRAEACGRGLEAILWSIRPQSDFRFSQADGKHLVFNYMSTGWKFDRFLYPSLSQWTKMSLRKQIARLQHHSMRRHRIACKMLNCRKWLIRVNAWACTSLMLRFL